MNFTMLSNIALAVRESSTYVPFSKDAWVYAGQMTLLGMLMVFAVLAILWMVLSIFKLLFAGKAPKEKKAERTEIVRNTAEPIGTPIAVHASNDEALIAVITAAVAAYMSEESGREVLPSGLRVVSFRRASTGRSWNTK